MRDTGIKAWCDTKSILLLPEDEKKLHQSYYFPNNFLGVEHIWQRGEVKHPDNTVSLIEKEIWVKEDGENKSLPVIGEISRLPSGLKELSYYEKGYGR